MKRRTLITVETDRIILMSGREVCPARWCAQCAGETRMVTVDEAAALTGVSSRTVYRRVEADELHFTETPEGLLLLCRNSLPR